MWYTFIDVDLQFEMYHTLSYVSNLIKDSDDYKIRRVYGQFCIEPLHESRKWKSNGQDTYTNSTVGGCIRPNRRGLTSRGGMQGGDIYTDQPVVIIRSAFNLKR